MKYLILWDIHWQYDKLIEILNKYFDISDKVIFLWDYIDRWKDSLKTLEYLLNMKKNNPEKVELLWWNHDIFLINSILYKDKKLFETWFYYNRAFESTFFDYVPWNDRVLFRDWYDEFIKEYHDKFMNDEYFLKLAKDLLNYWKLYYKDKKVFYIHWWFPILIVNKNEYKLLDFYNWLWEESLKNLENDYKLWLEKAILFFWKTSNNDPTWFDWAEVYERLTKEAFKNLLKEIWVKKMFVWHRKWENFPKYLKWNLLNCLNLWYLDIWFYYGNI